MVWRMLDATPTKANVMPRVHAHRRPEKKPIPAARYRIASITIMARNSVGKNCPNPTYPKHKIIQNPISPGPSTHLGYQGKANDIPANRSMIPARRAMPLRNVIPSGRDGVGFLTIGFANTGRLHGRLVGTEIWVLPKYAFSGEEAWRIPHAFWDS
jgi:hypothetical protein